MNDDVRHQSTLFHVWELVMLYFYCFNMSYFKINDDLALAIYKCQQAVRFLITLCNL